jgi:hypothetical protein
MQQYWNSHCYQFGPRFYPGLISSIVFHIIGAIAAVGLVAVSYQLYQSTLVIPENKPINVDIITQVDSKEQLEANVLKPDKLPQHVSRDHKPKELFPLKAINPNPNQSKPKGVAPKFYGQLLSRHFTRSMPSLPAGVKITENIDILIKIDRDGEIYDYAFQPHNISDDKLKKFLHATVVAANPVPTPPISEFTSEFAQYLVPLDFGIKKKK